METLLAKGAKHLEFRASLAAAREQDGPMIH